MCIERGFGEFTSFYSMAAGTGLCILFSASVSYGRLVQVRAWYFIVELVASKKTSLQTVLLRILHSFSFRVKIFKNFRHPIAGRHVQPFS